MVIKLDNDRGKTSTKQRILESAIHMFAKTGFMETSVRDLANDVGVNEASIYNHFPSKQAILEYILDEYAMQISIFEHDRLYMLAENPTADGILSCLTLAFPEGMEEYYMEELCVILQEQHRNPIVRKFMSDQIILSAEQAFEAIIDKLKELNILRRDTKADIWIKTYSSIIYCFASRFLLGIGDNSPDFSGMSMSDMTRNMCNMMLKTCGKAGK